MQYYWLLVAFNSQFGSYLSHNLIFILWLFYVGSVFQVGCHNTIVPSLYANFKFEMYSCCVYACKKETYICSKNKLHCLTCLNHMSGSSSNKRADTDPYPPLTEEVESVSTHTK